MKKSERKVEHMVEELKLEEMACLPFTHIGKNFAACFAVGINMKSLK